jgi:hypothetical protein
MKARLAPAKDCGSISNFEARISAHGIAELSKSFSQQMDNNVLKIDALPGC